MADDTVQVHAYEPWCGQPLVFPSYMVPSQMLVLPEVPFGEAMTASYALEPVDLEFMPAQQENLAPRTVSLADALGSEAMAVQELSAISQPQVMLHVDDLGLQHFAPAINQVQGDAVVDTWTLKFGELSHPPPPPAEFALGTAELPSVGSGNHAAGCCRPCAFFYSKGCESGLSCQFCHLCGPEERRRRRQEKLHERKQHQRARRERKASSSEVGK